ncbi:DUF2218 domain-containing protein [Halomonas sp. V046]|uniref:DUF2218 domain-containing protein n=1 Tax=Halomonas sp. V046 TaxID=3459611 RepID=UPI004044F516
MVESRSTIATASGQRLIHRLCKHWSHKLEVDAERGLVVFEGGRCVMQAGADTLDVRLDADDAEVLERLKAVVASHLERMAGKEELVVAWG